MGGQGFGLCSPAALSPCCCRVLGCQAKGGGGALVLTVWVCLLRWQCIGLPGTPESRHGEGGRIHSYLDCYQSALGNGSLHFQSGADAGSHPKRCGARGL